MRVVFRRPLVRDLPTLEFHVGGEEGQERRLRAPDRKVTCSSYWPARRCCSGARPDRAPGHGNGIENVVGGIAAAGDRRQERGRRYGSQGDPGYADGGIGVLDRRRGLRRDNGNGHEKDQDRARPGRRRSWPAAWRFPRVPEVSVARASRSRPGGGLGVGVMEGHGTPKPTALPTTRNGRGGRVRRRVARPPAGQCPRHEELALCDRLGHRRAPGQVGGDGGREGAAGAVVVPRGHTAPGRTTVPSGPATTSSAESVRWPPFTTTYRAPVALMRSARRPVPRGPEGLDVGVTEHGGLAEIRRDHQRVGEELLEIGRHAGGFEEAVSVDETRTGSTTSRGSSPRWARSDTAATVAAVASMPVFTAPTAKSSRTVSICCCTKAGSRATTPRTSAVFCAVTAVRAQVP